MRRRGRGTKRPLSRRRALMGLGAGLAAAGLLPSGAYEAVEGDRGSNAATSADSGAFLGLDNFQEGTVYKEPNLVTVTNQTGGPLGGAPDNTVESANGKLEFREVGDSGNSSNPFTLGSLAQGDSREFEIVTAASETGEVTDTVTLTYGDPSRASIVVTRDITVKFKASGQLVYAVDTQGQKADIRVYDAVNQVLNTPPQSVQADVIGANAADILNDSSADIPFAAKKDDKNLYATWVGASSDESIPKGNKPKLKKQKTRFALRPWPPSNLEGNLILAADNNASRIIGVTSGGTTDVIASPGNGCGGVAGVKDIDADGQVEMVFVDGSQQIRYLEQDGTTVKVQNGGVGSNNSTGFGSPADFPGGPNRPEIPFIDGSQNVALVTHDGTKTLLNSNGVAKKAAIAPVDVDGDGDLEFTFIGNDSGRIKYIDNVRGETDSTQPTNEVKTLQVNGSPVVPLEKVGLNSGT